MSTYDAYQSALHAMHVVLQATKGFDYACEKLDPLWEEPLPRDTCTAPMLARMLTEAGVPAISMYVLPQAIPARLVEVGRQGRLCVFETRRRERATRRRWGINHMWDGEQIHWLEVVSREDDAVLDLPPQETCTGWLVEVLMPVSPRPEVVAAIADPPRFRPSAN